MIWNALIVISEALALHSILTSEVLPLHLQRLYGAGVLICIIATIILILIRRKY